MTHSTCLIYLGSYFYCHPVDLLLYYQSIGIRMLSLEFRFGDVIFCTTCSTPNGGSIVFVHCMRRIDTHDLSHFMTEFWQGYVVAHCAAFDSLSAGRIGTTRMTPWKIGKLSAGLERVRHVLPVSAHRY